MLKKLTIGIIGASIISLSSCSKKLGSEAQPEPGSVKAELAYITKDTDSVSKTLSVSDVQYLEGEIKLTSEQKAALLEVAK